MSDATPPRTVRLVGLALVGIGLVEVVGLVAGLVLAGEGRFDTNLLALPAGALLLQGRTAWVRPALRVVQVVVVVVAAFVVLAVLGTSVPFDVAGGAADLGEGGRAFAVVLTLAQAALWLWLLSLAARLALPPEAA